MKTKKGWETSHPLTSKNLPEVKISRNFVNPTMVTCASNEFRAEFKYSNCLVSFPRKEKQTVNSKMNTGLRKNKIF